MSVPVHVDRGRRGRDKGAAAVEFALVMPIFFLLLMGIINYGFWFSDSLQMRQGVRESARQAVVQHAYTASPCTSLTGMNNVACGTRSQLSSFATPYLKIFVPSPGTWARGQQVVVCGVVQAKSFTNFVPMPASGVIRSQTTMSIENDTAPAPAAMQDTLPAGLGTWSWCTA